MRVISEGNSSLLAILKPMKKNTDNYRMISYCTELPTADGVLLHNLLTKEMVLLDWEENLNRFGLGYLKDHWFLVPEGANDKEYADFVQWVQETRKKKSKTVTNYSIFTTTDCNARCFYCYELGRSRVPMSKVTALKVVQYIKTHCDGKKVNLAWYGGEPLYNMEIIDIISDGLCKENVEFSSTMISNGYLFDEEVIRRAAESWNLKKIQITLDGTEEIYNRTKAYICAIENPYQKVIKNIELLLDAGIRVHIRMNMDVHNMENLLLLVDELTDRFGGRKNIHVYSYPIFKSGKDMAGIHSDEEWDVRFEAKRALDDKLYQCGLTSKRGITKTPHLYYCMADCGNAITILPDGNIGLCDHHSEDEFIGHIDLEGFNESVVASWKERVPEIPECADCFYYPNCRMLRKCVYSSVCFKQLREEKYRKIQRQMLNEYERWKNQADVEEDEEPVDC